MDDRIDGSSTDIPGAPRDSLSRWQVLARANLEIARSRLARALNDDLIAPNGWTRQQLVDWHDKWVADAKEGLKQANKMAATNLTCPFCTEHLKAWFRYVDGNGPVVHDDSYSRTCDFYVQFRCDSGKTSQCYEYSVTPPELASQRAISEWLEAHFTLEAC